MPRRTHSEEIADLQRFTAALKDQVAAARDGIAELNSKDDADDEKLVGVQLEVARLIERVDHLRRDFDGMKTRFWTLAGIVATGAVALIVQFIVKRHG